jgi:hypothetical protein
MRRWGERTDWHRRAIREKDAEAKTEEAYRAAEKRMAQNE